MTVHVVHSVWLNDTDACSVEYLAEASGLSIEEIEDLIECGVLVPIDEPTQTQAFPLHHVLTVKTARRLRDDFQLDRPGVALALTLLGRIGALEDELKDLLAQQRRPTTDQD